MYASQLLLPRAGRALTLVCAMTAALRAARRAAFLLLAAGCASEAPPQLQCPSVAEPHGRPPELARAQPRSAELQAATLAAVSCVGEFVHTYGGLGGFREEVQLLPILLSLVRGRQGVFLEIGASDGVDGSHSLIFEKCFNCKPPHPAGHALAPPAMRTTLHHNLRDQRLCAQRFRDRRAHRGAAHIF